MIVTALLPFIGYERAVSLIQEYNGLAGADEGRPRERTSAPSWRASWERT
jgi:hypothetical protein